MSKASSPGRNTSLNQALLARNRQAACEAGLRYTSDTRPGITRHGKSPAFFYNDPSSRKINDPNTLIRIKTMAIPPAWTEVWICPTANGHLQATGRDARGRKQYRYHSQWRQVRDGTKFDRMLLFGKCLPQIRKGVQRHLRHKTLSKDKVLAALVSLLEKSLIRVGNDEYASTNGSYGLTTMQDRHAKISGGTIRFHFTGKSGIRHDVEVRDQRLAGIVRKCQELPGQELFQYTGEDGLVHDLTSGDVNDYLRRISHQDFTAKDFRTWAGTVLAAMALREFQEFDSHAQAKKNILQAIGNVAGRLGNTPAVCRKCYIHPAVLDAYLDKSMLETVRVKAHREMTSALSTLPPEEAAVLALLERRLAQRAS